MPVMLRCGEARLALSSWLDGEGVPTSDAAAHLEDCPACRGWLEGVESLQWRTRLLAAAEPALGADVTPAVLAHLQPEPARRRRARVALGVVAGAQLLLAIAAFVGHRGDHAHTAHELGAWDAALAVGLLFAALRPARAWGMLPLVAALVTCLGVTSIVDIASGGVGLTREVSHLLAVLSLWLLSRIGGVPAVRPSLRLAQ